MGRVLIAGCGYVGAALGVLLAEAGHDVWGLRRDTAGLPPRLRPCPADLERPRTLRNLPEGLECVFYTAAPEARDEAAHRAAYVEGPRNLLAALRAQGQNPRRVFFTSTTGVYAQCAGKWVDEDTPAAPVRFPGICALEGERVLREGPYPATVLRLGGIYGPGRTRLLERLRRGEASYPPGPPAYTNRIHRDDCAGALAHLMNLDRPESLYLGVDDEPAERKKVLLWLAERMGAPPPREAPGRGSARGDNKRCRNARFRASGYAFRYPTFREGYSSLLGDPAESGPKNP